MAADRRAALAARPPAGRRLRDLLAACRSNAVALSSACLILTTLVTGVLGYAYWIAAARAFAVHDVGLVVTLVSAVVLVADVGNLGFGLGAAYVLPKAADRWGGTVAGFLLAAGGCSAALGALAALAAVLAGAEAAAVERPALVAGLFVLTCAAWAASLVLDQILTIEGAAGLLLLRNALASLGRLLLLPAVVALEPAEAVVALFASWGASTLAAGGLALALLARTGGRRLRWRPDLGAVRAALPLSLANHLLMTVEATPALVLPLLVAFALSTEAAAYFYATWMVAFALFTVPQSAGAALFSHTAGGEALGRRNALRATALTVAVAAPPVVAVVAARDLILGLFGAAYAEQASSLLAALAVATLPMSAYHVYLAVLRVERRFGRALLAATCLTVATLGSAALATSSFGLAGVGLALLGCYAAAAGLSLCDLCPRTVSTTLGIDRFATAPLPPHHIGERGRT